VLLAEKVRAFVAALPVVFDGGPLALTVSFGVAEHSPTGSFDATLGAADGALYRAKEEGRDRVAASPAPARERTGRHG
jgi:PleD family two-component response regulator